MTTPVRKQFGVAYNTNKSHTLATNQISEVHSHLSKQCSTLLYALGHREGSYLSLL
jgi:hypothetical protein